MCPVILFWITSWGIFPGAGGRSFADARSAASRSHKPRPSTKDRGATSSVHPSVPHGHHCPCDPPVSQHDRSSRAAVGLRYPAAPPRQPACRHLPNGPQKRGSWEFFTPSPPQLRQQKELTPLSDHTFVRSMTWAWCHSRHLPKKLAPSNKSVYYNNTNYKKMQQYTRIIFIFRPPAGLFRILASPYNPLNSQKYPAGLGWWFFAK